MMSLEIYGARSTGQEALDYARGELEVLGKASRPVLLVTWGDDPI